MARRTMRLALDAVTLHELRPESGLVFRDVAHVEYLFPRADELLRIAMAVQAPLHRQRRGLIHQIHAIDRAVAGRAADAFGHVDVMFEMDEVGQAMDAT